MRIEIGNPDSSGGHTIIETKAMSVFIKEAYIGPTILTTAEALTVIERDGGFELIYRVVGQQDKHIILKHGNISTLEKRN